MRRFRGESGQSVVEFGVVLPLLCALVLVFVDFGKGMNYWLDLTHGANEGARLAAVDIDITKPPYNASGATSLADYIKKGLETDELRTNATVSICGGPGTFDSPVTVQVKYNYNWIPFIGGSLTLKSKATMRLEHDATHFTVAATCPS
jgi:Flp pilus assembly protein TadG